MIITNRLGLSEAWVNAVTRDDYDKVGDYSASELPNPPRQVILSQRHDHEVEEDVTDRIWMLFGSAGHYVLEKANDDKSLTEERFTVMMENDIVLSMKPDRLCPLEDRYRKELGIAPGDEVYHLRDLKISSVWSYIFREEKDDWQAQTNIYRYGLNRIGFPVAKISIELLMRDWSRSEWIKKGGPEPHNDYPPCQVAVIDIPVWDMERTEAYIEGRIGLFEDAKKQKDDDLPFCTPEERWAKPDRFAVMKKGGKKASKLCSTKDEAEQWRAEKSKPGDYEIVFRPGESIRCERYCSARPFCSQYQQDICPAF